MCTAIEKGGSCDYIMVWNPFVYHWFLWGESTQIDRFNVELSRIDAYMAQLWWFPFASYSLLAGLRPVIQILCHVLARGWGRWLRYINTVPSPKSEGQNMTQDLNDRSQSQLWHDTHSSPSKLTKQVPKTSFTYDHRRHLILPLQPVHALPTLNAR